MVKLSDLSVTTSYADIRCDVHLYRRPATVSDLVEALIAEGAVDYEAAAKELWRQFDLGEYWDSGAIVNAALGIGKETE